MIWTASRRAGAASVSSAAPASSVSSEPEAIATLRGRNIAAFVELPQIRALGWGFLIGGAVTWAAALTWVRRAAS